MMRTQQSYTWQGLHVTPIEGTKRRVPGGIAVDIRIDDSRSTITHSTVNALHVIDRQGQPYSYGV